MKKIFFLLYIIVFVAGSAFAQETTPVQDVPEPLTSKRGVPILPEYGEWGLGVSADPFLYYLGNFMNGATAGNFNQTFDWAAHPAEALVNPAIFGKYIVDENTAYRVRFNVNIATNVTKEVIAQDQLSPDPLFPAFTEDWRKNSVKNFVLAAGLEKRRGVSRLQGVYGGELVFGLTKSNVEYQYGNPITADFNDPTTSSALGGVVGNGVRQTEVKGGSTFLIGARGFIGVEYFLAPKISVGGEFGYTIGFQTEGKNVVTTEQWNPVTQSIHTIKTDVYPGGTGFTSIGASLDRLNGAISLLFYF